MRKSAKQVFIFSLIGLMSFLLTACPGKAPQPNDKVVATVNGKPIMMKEVETILNQKYQGQQSNLSKLELSQERLQILDGLIQQAVLFQRAEGEKLLPTEDEITTKINEQIQQSGKTKEAIDAELKASGQTEVSFREEVRKLLAIQKLQDKITNKVKQPDDKTVEEYYNANKDYYVRGRGVDLAIISVDPQENQGLNDDAKTEADAKAKIDQIHQQLMSGADFADVARRRSEDQYSVRGGDIGFQAEAQLKQTFGDELVTRFFGLEAGSFTKPEKIGNAWVIFKVKGKQLQTENLTLSNPEVKADIIKKITDGQKQVLATALQLTAINEAKIENLLAKELLDNPENLNPLRPAPNPNATPAASATPAPTTAPATSPSASPKTAASPAAKASPNK